MEKKEPENNEPKHPLIFLNFPNEKPQFQKSSLIVSLLNPKYIDIFKNGDKWNFD
jgi:hypothetical protein